MIAPHAEDWTPETVHAVIQAVRDVSARLGWADGGPLSVTRVLVVGSYAFCRDAPRDLDLVAVVDRPAMRRLMDSRAGHAVGYDGDDPDRAWIAAPLGARAEMTVALGVPADLWWATGEQAGAPHLCLTCGTWYGKEPGEVVEGTYAYRSAPAGRRQWTWLPAKTPRPRPSYFS